MEDVADFLRECGIGEEDEVTVSGLFEQYEIRGRKQGRAEGRTEGRAEGRESTILSNVRALMQNLSMTAEQAMQALNVPQNEQTDYLARL